MSNISHVLEAVSTFCSHPDNPQTVKLPSKFCQEEFFCAMLKDPWFLGIITFVALFALFLWSMAIWWTTHFNVVCKFIDLHDDEIEFTKYMISLAPEPYMRKEMEMILEERIKERQRVKSQSGNKEASSEGAGISTIEV